MDRTARVTLVQADWEAEEPLESLAALEAAVERHAAASDLIVFPELAVHGHEVTLAGPRHIAAALRAVGAEDIERFHRTIADRGAHVIYGKAVERDGRMLNVATYVDARGALDYAKTHVHWSERFHPGEGFRVVDSPLGPLGMLICFDAAFPEPARVLALLGAKVIVNISAIPEHFDIKHVHRRVQACSVFNQVYTLFCNRTGHGHLGGSCVVDPVGERLAVASSDDESITVDLDLTLADSWRSAEPILPHRRPALYAPITQTTSADERTVMTK